MKSNIEISQYSTFNPAMFEKSSREIVARQILFLLKKHLSENKEVTSDKTLLDIGCSSGIMTNLYASKFKKTYGIDVDSSALNYAKNKNKNISFKKASATKTTFKNNTFDVVVANQIYMWVFDQKSMVNEIHRILKPGGVCFLGARNKYTFWDAQYYLPLIAFMPKFAADKYVKIFGKTDSYESKYLSFWELERFYGKKFKIYKYSPLIMNDPKKYGYKKLAKYQKILNLVPKRFWGFTEPMLPNFVWILEKPAS